MTDSAGRWSDVPLGSGSPVSGAFGGGAVVVVGGTVVVVVVFFVASSVPPPPEAATIPTATPSTTTSPTALPTRIRERLVTYISLSRAIRSSSGGWVSNRRLSFVPRRSVSVSSGCSIHICAVAFVA